MKLNLVPLVVTGIGVSAPIPTDSRAAAPTIGCNCVVTTAGTYIVQYTQDDPYAAYPGSTFAASANWYTAPAFAPGGTLTPLTASSATTMTNVFATAIRLNVTVGGGSVSIMAWQSDSTQGA